MIILIVLFPAHIGLAKRPANVVGQIGLPSITPFVPPSRGINQVINGCVTNGKSSYVNNDASLGQNIVS